MKKIIKHLATVTLVVFTTLSFTNIKSDKKQIKVDKSEVLWKGYKVTGSHEGTIGIKSGALVFEANKLIGGEVTIDMTSINTTDLTGEYKNNLDGHLKSDDFFGVANHPTATLVFTEVTPLNKNTYNVKGDLTIKGKTNPVNFTMSINGNKATASLKVDRTKYGVKYGSASFFDDLKDKAIYDEFDLVTNLEF